MIGELDGITHQVIKHLTQTQRIAAQVAGHIGGDEVHHLHAFFLGAQRGDGRDSFQNVVERKLHGFQSQHAGLYLRKIQNVVDDGQQGIGRQLHLLQIIALLG